MSDATAQKAAADQVRALVASLNSAINQARAIGVLVKIRENEVNIIGERFPHSQMTAECSLKPADI